MLTIVNDQGPNVALKASGLLDKTDYDHIVPELERLIEKYGRLRLLIFLEDFKGWTTEAFLKDLRFDIRHRKDFDRIAIVGESTLHKLGTKLTAPFFDGEVRYFDTSETDKAAAWLRQAVFAGSPQEE